MTKSELHAQIDSMTDEEAAQVKLIFAPEWPSKATSAPSQPSCSARPTTMPSGPRRKQSR